MAWSSSAGSDRVRSPIDNPWLDDPLSDASAADAHARAPGGGGVSAFAGPGDDDGSGASGPDRGIGSDDLAPADLFAVGGGVASRGCRAVLGPGTGLGVAVLAERDGVRLAVPSEGGHSSFSPVDALEIEILRHMTEIHGRVSNERLISGPGLEALHLVLADIDGRPREPLAARQIIDAGLKDRTSNGWRTISTFCAIFGTMAGDVALLVGAVGGIYLAGGIAQRLATAFADTPFRDRFEAKGRLSYFTQDIPVHVITGAYVALDGAARAYADLGPDGHRHP